MEVNEILSSREKFNSLVYTPWEQALEELRHRKSNAQLDAFLGRLLPHGVPPAMRGAQSMVLFRHIATSNYEIYRFLAVADALHELKPLILEYGEDKFNDRNEGKYFLGKLCFHKGVNKKGEAVWESIRVIDFNASNNKPISAVTTIWGQSLVDFHHELFQKSFPRHTDCAHDISEWLRSFGPTAKDYYKQFLALFLRDGILFENFFIDEKEFSFTKTVIVPAIEELIAEAGVKPLIVTLAPTEIEGDQFWHAHPYTQKAIVDEKMERSAI
ncbi:MAG TPA: hypothetical protein VHC20_07380 [Candidatus Paceibacterota bacterium]|nr:hypothetical protein [Candidatus Paceibacterota bacterium]